MGYKKRSEATEQEAVIAWSKYRIGQYPELEYLHHVPNGGSRHRIEAINLKLQGVKAGVPDLVLPVPKSNYKGLYIEMKFDKNTLSADQKKWLQAMAEYGHYTCTCYAAAYAINTIETYLNLEAGQEMPFANNHIFKPSKGEII